MNIKDMFDAVNDEHTKFENIEKPLSRYADIHAFLLLDSLVPVPPHNDMICAAEHDKIYLAVEMRDFKKVATLEIVRDLRRCGVCYDAETESLYMFV